MVVTAENMTALGNVTTAIAEALLADEVYDKTVFGLAGQADILASVQRQARRTAILVGLETGVCGSVCVGTDCRRLPHSGAHRRHGVARRRPRITAHATRRRRRRYVDREGVVLRMDAYRCPRRQTIGTAITAARFSTVMRVDVIPDANP